MKYYLFIEQEISHYDEENPTHEVIIIPQIQLIDFFIVFIEKPLPLIIQIPG